MAGADPNAVDDEGESVLHRAVAKKFTARALVILENGGCKSMGILNSKNLTQVKIHFFFSLFIYVDFFFCQNDQERQKIGTFMLKCFWFAIAK